MKKFLILIISLSLFYGLSAQTLLTEAENFHVKTIYGETIWLFPILDEEEQVVVIDFFSTTCGPCQDYADDFQRSYEAFGSNSGNVFHMGINWGNDNQGVHEFDSIFELTFPSVSGTQGGGNIVFNQYQIQSYPTVIVINTAHEITDQYVWLPSEENIEEAIIAAGGMLVGTDEKESFDTEPRFYPNPASTNGAITLSLSKAAKVTYMVYDIYGKQVLSGEEQFLPAGRHSIPIPVAQLADGCYFIKIGTGDQKWKTIRFIVGK